MSLKLLPIILLFTFNIFAQSLEEERYEVVNTTYPNQKIVFTCLTDDCSNIEIYSEGTEDFVDREYLYKGINLEWNVEESKKKTIKLKVRVKSCDEGKIAPGIPCFAGTTTALERSRDLKNEGRKMWSILNSIIGVPAGFVVDIGSTGLFFIGALQHIEIENKNEITKREKRNAKRRIRALKYFQKKVRNEDGRRVILLNHKHYRRLVRKLKFIPNPLFDDERFF